MVDENKIKMTTQQCKTCKRRYKILVNGICCYCNPGAWAIHFKNKYRVKK